MKKKLSGLFLVLAIFMAFTVSDVTFANSATTSKSNTGTVVSTKKEFAVCVKPYELLNDTDKYLHKRVCMSSKFSKFTTLGLDYKPAYKSSENYISFIFLKENTEHKIPFSEVKMFISRKTAEKLPDIKEGDLVKVEGVVFSNALGDAWVDVDTFEVIKK